MPAEAWGFIGVLSGAVIGATASIVATVLTNRHQGEQGRLAESRRREQNARDLQFENLRALGDAANELILALIDYGSYQESAFARTGTWGAVDAPRMVEVTLDHGMLKMVQWSNRVWSDDVREAALTATGSLSDARAARSPDQARLAMTRGISDVQQLHERIGVVMRRLQPPQKLPSHDA